MSIEKQGLSLDEVLSNANYLSLNEKGEFDDTSQEGDEHRNVKFKLKMSPNNFNGHADDSDLS